jgi:hypothetical protein
MEWGYAYTCGCLVFEVKGAAGAVTVKPCSPRCPNREDAIRIVTRQRDRVAS